MHGSGVRVKLKLFVKKPLYVPTLLGWLLLVIVTAALSVVCIGNAYSFLAYQRPVDADVFIIEGWVPDHVLEECPASLQSHACRLVLATGGPLSVGSDLSQYHSYAEMTAARLAELGFQEEQIIALPNEGVDKGRTYAAALEVRQWLSEHPDVTGANLVTLGPHARRSYLTFRRVLPPTFALGVCAVPPREYDSDCWWRCSAGARTVVGEGIAYFYARCIGTH